MRSHPELIIIVLAIAGFAGVLVYGQFSTPGSGLLAGKKDGAAQGAQAVDGADVTGADANGGTANQAGDFQSQVDAGEQAEHQPTAGRYFSGNKERFLKDGSPFGQGFPQENEVAGVQPPGDAASVNCGGTINSGGIINSDAKPEDGASSNQGVVGGVSTVQPANNATQISGAKQIAGATSATPLLATTGGVSRFSPVTPPGSVVSPSGELVTPSASVETLSEEVAPPAVSGASTSTNSSENSPPALPVLKGPNVVLGSRFAADAARQGLRIPGGGDALYGAVMRYYGATFVANPRLKLPNQVIFEKSSEVSSYQKTLPLKRARLGRYSVCLQEEALTALQAAQKEALQNRLTISPVGDIASLRSYQDTTYIWHKYLEKGLSYWVSKHKLTEREARAILSSPMKKQLNAVLALEAKGFYLHANHIHSILNLAAPPGCSQHISGLALDVVEHQNWRVRSILNKHGWFQTVAHDFPHFIYLGRDAKELSGLGLTPVVSDGRQFWVPDIPVLQASNGSTAH